MGFDIRQFSPVHYRISRKFKDTSLDVFPTRKTYCLKRMGKMHFKKRYEDLISLCELAIDFDKVV